MLAHLVRGSCRGACLFATARGVFLAAILTVAGTNAAFAFLGPSFLQMPGVAGGWQGDKYKDWVRVESQYWQKDPVGRGRNAGGGRDRNALFYNGPTAPQQGENVMVIAVDKRSPALQKLMDACAAKTILPEVTYAESSYVDRNLLPLGPRPAAIPEYFEYKLTDVQLTDCPVLAGAPDQAFVVKSGNIQWLNYPTGKTGEVVTLEPKTYKPVKSTGATKTFVVTWLAFANEVSDDQCPKFNSGPTEADYYALVPKEAAAKERAERASAGGVSYQNGDMELRGPGRLNVCKLPGIVPDPGFIAPSGTVARGLNLDDDDGTGDPPPGTCKHKNYVSADGKQTGIDNQIFTVEGCIPGYLGRKGRYSSHANEERKNGLVSILFDITGIDNEQNDDSVDIEILYSLDPMAKDTTGDKILSGYTFRITDRPDYAYYITHLHGKIVDGVLITDPVKELKINPGHPGAGLEIVLEHAKMQLQFMPDGSLKGVVGGYFDWVTELAGHNVSTQENEWGYQCPALYDAYKRAADGMKDPVTGECTGISTAYDIEGVPAFIPPDQRSALMALASRNR